MTSPGRRARRDRQLLEITALIAAGAHQRAAGLALEHLAGFPQDAGALTDALADRHPPADAGPNQERDR